MKRKIKNILIKTSLGASIATAIVAVAAEGSITTPRAVVFGVCVGWAAMVLLANQERDFEDVWTF